MNKNLEIPLRKFHVWLIGDFTCMKTTHSNYKKINPKAHTVSDDKNHSARQKIHTTFPETQCFSTRIDSFRNSQKKFRTE